MKFDWSRDLIHDAIGPLIQVDHLWTAQAFTKPTDSRRKEIKKLINQAITELESILAELEE